MNDRKTKGMLNIIIVFVVVGVITYLALSGITMPFRNTQLMMAPSGLLSNKKAQNVQAGINYLNRRDAEVNLNEFIPSPAMLYNTVPGLGSTPAPLKENIEWNNQNYPVDEDLFGDNNLTWNY